MVVVCGLFIERQDLHVLVFSFDFLLGVSRCRKDKIKKNKLNLQRMNDPWRRKKKKNNVFHDNGGVYIGFTKLCCMPPVIIVWVLLKDSGRGGRVKEQDFLSLLILFLFLFLEGETM